MPQNPNNSTVFVSTEKERRARMIVENKGINPRRNPLKEFRLSMEEKAYAKAVAEYPDLSGEPLVVKVYENLLGIVLTGKDAERESEIRAKIRKADEVLR